MFTKTTIISALAGLAAAAPAPRSTNPNVFETIALHSGSPIHLSGINANGFNFYIGKPTGAYCPPGVEDLDCSAFGNQTVFEFNPSANALGLYATVPGGQQVYVRADGSLGYTIAHSAAIPNDAYTTPFGYNAQSSDGTVGTLTFEGSSFSACPSGEANVYQIFASAVSPDTQVNCIGINMGTAIVDGSSAPFQYD